MVILVSAVFGILLGGYQAKKRGGNLKDIAQYATAYGIAFTLLGFVIAIILDRTVI